MSKTSHKPDLRRIIADREDDGDRANLAAKAASLPPPVIKSATPRLTRSAAIAGS
jgi:hypothetical protein